ncbi:MAG: FG-GAP-like repeat-containing protein [Planctomycetota bacterium]
MSTAQRSPRSILAAALVTASFACAAAAQAPAIQWWHDLDAPSFGSAAVGDLDGDGRPEIVFGTYFNDERIVALNAEDGSVLWTYDTGGCNDASPVIADVDLDGALEVVVPGSSVCRVFCLAGATGALEWSASTGTNSIDSPPAVADLDRDGKPEIVFGTFFGHVYCLDGEDGGQVWRADLGATSHIQSEPGIADLDGDGALDVVVAQWAGDCRVYGRRGSDGGELWHSDAPGDWMYHGGSLADVDEDGKLEIAIGCYDGKVYLLNAEDGSTAWTYPGTFYMGAPTSIADLDGDGHLEIVYVDYDRVGVLSHTGTRQWQITVGGNVFRGAALADVDGNGGLDLVFGCDDGKLRARRGADGGAIWEIDLGAHCGAAFEMDHAPVLADFDGDGKLDAFVVGGHADAVPANNHGRAYAVTAGEGTGPGWPMFRHDAWHSGRFGFAPPVAAAAFRNAGGNPASHAAATLPRLGSTYTARIDLGGTTGHSLAWLAGYATPITATLGGGQVLLVNAADPNGELLGQAFVPGPLATYDLSVPPDLAFAGFAAATQALHLGGVQPFALSNAQDLCLGY